MKLPFDYLHIQMDELLEARAAEAVRRHVQRFRRYRSASVYLTRPFVEAYWTEVQQESAGKFILNIDVVR